MISCSEATKIVHSELFLSKPISVKLLKSLGRVLREDLLADRDLPPYHRVTMDGIAISFEQYEKGQREFVVAHTQRAGMPEFALQVPNQCVEVMTGAMLPIGTDTVIRYEDLEALTTGETLSFKIQTYVQKGQNIHYRGSDAQTNQILVPQGTKISPAEIGVAAAIGKSNVVVSQKPLFAILSTGDELVDIESKPQNHQIRRSNAFMLHAALEKLNCKADTFHLPDNKEVIKQKLAKILAPNSVFDAILLSGGVSAGRADFVPEVLEALGVIKLFHQVAQRPGKPFWFGKTQEGKAIFALPGNPISTFVCFHRYVVPWLKASLLEANPLDFPYAILMEDVTFKPPLTYFMQVKIHYDHTLQKLCALPVEGGGSGDFANLLQCDGFLELPAERSAFHAGETFPLITYR